MLPANSSMSKMLKTEQFLVRILQRAWIIDPANKAKHYLESIGWHNLVTQSWIIRTENGKHQY